MTINMTTAKDQLVAATRDKVPGQIELAARTLAQTGDRDEALAQLTIHFQMLPAAAVAAIAADGLLRLAEETR